LTFSCWQRLPLLDDDRYKVMLSRAIDAAVGRTGFHVVGFVFMPEHVHLILQPMAGVTVRCVLWQIKRPVGLRALAWVRANVAPRSQ
jgi:putative transposase